MTSLFRLLSQRKTKTKSKSNELLQLLPPTNTSKNSASTLSLKNTKKINDLLLICEKKILTEMKTKLLNGELNYDKNMRVSNIETFNEYSKIDTEDITTEKSKNSLSVLLNYVLYNNFCKPIISINNEYKGEGDPYTRHYKTFTTKDKILIWGIMNQEGIYHLTAQIITDDNQYYSLGFAMSSFEPIINNKKSTKLNSNSKIGSLLAKLPSSINTSDMLFEYKLYKHLFNNKNQTHVKLIASSYLTEQHLANINQYFDSFSLPETITCTNYIYILDENLFDEEQQINNEKHNNIYIKDVLKNKKNYKNNRMQLTNTINFITQNIKNRFGIVSNYSFNDENLNYCKFSGTQNNKQANCSSFLFKLFDSILNCGFKEKIVVDPTSCKQKDNTKMLDCSVSQSNQKEFQIASTSV